MITVKQQSKFMDRIKTMSELEIYSFMEEFIGHLEKNKMTHLLGNYDQQDEIDELNEDNERLDEENEKLSQKLVDIAAICDNGMDIEEFEEDAFDTIQKSLQQIKDLC